ncbi:protein HEG homolog 1 [Polypterus senegalus]
MLNMNRLTKLCFWALMLMILFPKEAEVAGSDGPPPSNSALAETSTSVSSSRPTTHPSTFTTATSLSIAKTSPSPSMETTSPKTPAEDHTTASVSPSTSTMVTTSTKKPAEDHTTASVSSSMSTMETTSTKKPAEDHTTASVSPSMSTMETTSTKAPAEDHTTASVSPSTSIMETTSTKKPAEDHTTASVSPSTSIMETTSSKTPAEDHTTASVSPSTSIMETTSSKTPAEDHTTASVSPSMSTMETTSTKKPAEDQTTASVNPSTSTLETTSTKKPAEDSSSTSPPTSNVTNAPAVTTVARPTTSTPGNTKTTLTTSTSSFANKCTPGACPTGSNCVELFNNFTCQCPQGFYYNSASGCFQVKTFPGTLHINSSFTSDMAISTSQSFLETSSKIVSELKKILQGTNGYISSSVLQLQPGSILATVDNVYQVTSNINSTFITGKISNLIETCTSCGILDRATFSAKPACAVSNGGCDSSSTVCSAKDGTITCTCKEGFVATVYSTRQCVACESGMKVENGSCVPCPFGYRGFNCNESYLLAVVVISCVLGGVLLLILLALIIFCCHRARSSSWYSSPYSTNEYTTWPKQEVPRIPRVTTQWDPNHMEMVENGSTRNLVNKDKENGEANKTYDVSLDDLKTFKNKNPSRYSYLCQGQENPYFVSDEEKQKSK